MTPTAQQLIWLTPVVTTAIVLIIGIYVAIFLFSAAKKLHKELMRSLIADCIVQNNDYEEFADVDDLFARVILAQQERKNLSVAFVEGAYLLFLKHRYARDRMMKIHQRIEGRSELFSEALRSWKERGLEAGMERLTTRIDTYDSFWKRSLLLLLKKRLEKFRVKTIEGFSEIFLGLKTYLQEQGDKPAGELIMERLKVDSAA